MQCLLVLWHKAEQARADEHMDVHKNQFSSTPYAAAALIRHPNENQGFVCITV